MASVPENTVSESVEDTSDRCSSSSAVVSLLDRLKCHCCSQTIGRKRKARCNRHPLVSDIPRDPSVASDPKGVVLTRFIQDFPNQL